MDSDKSDLFDEFTGALSSGRSRRMVARLLGVLAVAPLVGLTEAEAKRKKWKKKRKTPTQTPSAEACIPTGKRCPAKKLRGQAGPNGKPKTLGCDTCCQRFSVSYRNRKGKTVRKCDCKPAGQPTSTNEAWQCCSSLSDGSRCVNPLSPPGERGPVGCPGVCQTCNPTTGICAVDTNQNGQPGANCAAPQVCCSGACCDPIHECNAAGTCATCAEVCPNAGCSACFNTTEGGTICAAIGVFNCSSACTSSSTCGGGNAACLISFTDKVSNTTTPMSAFCSGLSAGACTTFAPC